MPPYAHGTENARRTFHHTTTMAEDIALRSSYAWASLRIALGAIFFWAFLDKTFGLAFATKPEAAWIRGGSPTQGFLEFGTKGPFKEFFGNIAGHPFTDALFMLGLAAVGLA